MKAKNSCVLTTYISQLTNQLSAGTFSDWVDLLAKQKTKIETLEKMLLPESLQEFRNSAYYCLPSQIKKYEGFMPKAKPIPGLHFKNEPVYWRKHITELHTQQRWLKH